MRFHSMPTLFRIAVWILLSLLGALEGFSADSSDPAARWVTVYGWVQTGERLNKAGQPALALGSYIEAHQRLKKLRADHPDFEPEITGFRYEWLESEIQRLDETLDASEHDVMMKYLDFVELLEQGIEERFANKFADSLTTLDIARKQMDELIEKKPESFREAIASQYERLEDNIDWLYGQVNFKERSRQVSSYVPDGVDWGTTKYIRESDLPSERGNMTLSGALFPGVTVPEDAKPSPMKELENDSEETTDSSNPKRAFRMSTRQKPGNEEEESDQ